MPYPPPPGPPFVGEFQAIGLLPAPQLPDVTGNAGKFLETDGIIPQWEPVGGGVLPPQTGHSGDFLTTDGATPSWATLGSVLPPQSGHTGQFLTTDGAAASWTTIAGGGILAIGSLTSPTANAAVITGGNTLNLAPADITHPGAISTTTQTAGGLKLWTGGSNSSLYDSRLRGAVQLFDNVTPSLAINDFGPAWYNTIASWSTSLGVASIGSTSAFGTGAVEIPEGAFFTSMPLCVPGNAIVSGKGWLNTMVAAGYGNGSTPSQVQGFAGPVFYVAPPYRTTVNALNFPIYDSPLVGIVGQSITIDPAFSGTFQHSNNQWFLHDAIDWIKFGALPQTNFGLQCFVRMDGPVTPVQNYEGAIVSSQGPNIWTNLGDHIDRAFALFATSTDGVNYQFRAYLTTNPAWASPFEMQKSGTLHSITSVNIVLGNIYNLEISYDGSHFAFYLNGVNQGNLVVSGPIVQASWEGVAIGTAGPEFTDGSGDAGTQSIKGAVYSLRLSNMARHTGTGSFTPPVTAYTWDSNTCALYNFDIPNKSYQPVDYTGSPSGPLIILPFVLGQARAATTYGDVNTPPSGPVNHFIRTSGAALSQGSIIQDLCVQCNASTAGVITSASPEVLFKNLYINNPTSFGIRIGTAVSFYAVIQDCRVSLGINYGFQYIGDGLRLQTQSCGIGIHCSSGNVWSANNQPAFNAYAAMILGPGASQAEISVKSCTVDTEFWHYRRTRGMVMVYGTGLSALTFENNGFSAGLTEGPPILFIGSAPEQDVISTKDAYFANTSTTIAGLAQSPATVAVKYSPQFPGQFLLVTPSILTDPSFPLPIALPPGFVTVVRPSKMSNWQGISLSDVQANNLGGTFTVRGAFTQGGPNFLVAEPDANYQVNITPISALGGSPAAGSTSIVSYSARANGFTATTAAAPGGNVEVTFGWQLLRTLPPPLFFSYNPAIPSTFTNPLAGATEPWFVGMTFVPVTGHLIAFDASLASAQTGASAGTTIGGANWWFLGFDAEVSGIRAQADGGTIDGPNATARGGKLVSPHSPGAHNVVFGVTAGNQYYFNIDGLDTTFQTGITAGLQQTPVYVGELFDTTLPLTSATIRNLKFSNQISQVTSNDNDIGPGSQLQALILGDEISYGASDTSGTGGYAGQIQTNKYGTTFYHSGTIQNGQITGALGLTGIPGLAIDIWGPFQGLSASAPALTALVIFAGIHDIIADKLATDIFASIRNIVEGAFASATWIPPTSFLTPTDQRAFAVLTGARTAGTSNYVIDGTPIASTFNTNSHQTVLDLQTAIVANGALNTNWVTTPVENPVGSGVWGLTMNWRVPGSVGNHKAFTCDGGAGGFLFGDVGDGVGGTGLAVASIGGVDTTCKINNTTFVANFNTNAATTVNALVSAINASGAVNTLVTASNVGNQCFIIANNRGLAGSSIRIVGVPVNIPGGTAFVGYNSFQPPGVLQGGEDGAITKGIGTILICNVQPFGTDGSWTAPREAQRAALNTSIAGYTGAGVTIVDVESTLWDPAHHTNINPTLGTGFVPNTAGHTALYALIHPLLP